MRFEMEPEEIVEEKLWWEKHKWHCKYLESVEPLKWKHLGAIGGGRHYEIVPTSIGSLLNIACSCGGEENTQCLNAHDL